MQLTKENVLAAYAKLKPDGYTPIRKRFYHVDKVSKTCRVCALSALAIANGCEPTNGMFDPMPWIAEKTGLSQGVQWAFIDGFDGNSYGGHSSEYPKDDPVLTRELYELGQQIAKEVFPNV